MRLAAEHAVLLERAVRAQLSLRQVPYRYLEPQSWADAYLYALHAKLVAERG